MSIRLLAPDPSYCLRDYLAHLPTVAIEPVASGDTLTFERAGVRPLRHGESSTDYRMNGWALADARPGEPVTMHLLSLPEWYGQ